MSIQERFRRCISSVRAIQLAGSFLLASRVAYSDVNPPPCPSCPQQFVNDKCVKSALLNVGYSVPFEAATNRPGGGPVTYSDGTVTTLYDSYFHVNYVYGKNNRELFSNRYEPCPNPNVPCFANTTNPFWIGASHMLTFNISELGGLIYVTVQDQTTNAQTTFQGQCGGPSGELLYGFDSSTMYVISFGNPYLPPPNK